MAGAMKPAARIIIGALLWAKRVTEIHNVKWSSLDLETPDGKLNEMRAISVGERMHRVAMIINAIRNQKLCLVRAASRSSAH